MKKTSRFRNPLKWTTISLHSKGMIIRLLIVLLLLPGFSYVRAQNATINVSVKNISLRDALRQIEKVSEKRIFMSDDVPVLNKVVNVDIRNKSFEDAMYLVLNNTGLTFQELENGSIIIVEDAGFTQKNIPITGYVRDSRTKESLPGVTVMEVGTNKGTVTNENGQFKMTVSDAKANLVLSFIGYKSTEVAVGDKKIIHIDLKEDVHSLDEVVVLGYGQIAKSDLTGAVSSIKTENTAEKAVSSVEQILQGQVSGVQITSNSGGTGSGITFNIRGVTSVTGSNQPLIVLDGYPIDSDNSGAKMSGSSQSGYLADNLEDNALANLNPNDIASIEILKDASATAIYGSRGANGVVLITTKRGQSGRNRIEYSYRYDSSRVPKKIDVLNTAEFIAYRNEGYMNQTGSPDPSYDTQAEIDLATQINTNWQDLIFQTSISQNHQLNFSGGDQKMRYAMTLGYYDQEGIIKNSQFERGSIRFNFDREFSKNFKFGMNFNGVMSTNKAAMQAASGTNPSQSVIVGALRSRPTLSPLTEDELIDQNLDGNPLTLIELSHDVNKTSKVLVNMFGEYTILPGLSAIVRGGLDRTYAHRDFYHPRGTTLGNVQGGYAYSGDIDNMNYSTEFTLNLNKTFAKIHKFNTVVGYQWQNWLNRRQAINAFNFPNDNLLYYDLGVAGSFNAPSTYTYESALASYFGRVNYSLNSKYMITFTGRADGSTRLAEGNKWHFFPAVALGWNAHNEKFLSNLDFLSQLKVRGSYGLSGNQSIDIGATKSTLSSGTAVINQSIVTAYRPGNMPDDNLGWETTTQFNVGTDISFINNRLRFSFEYYNKVTEDMLISLSLPPSATFTSYSTNFGSIRNYGYEFDLGFSAITGNNFTWDINGNLSFNRNKVLDLGDLDALYGSTFGAVGSQSLHIAKVGYPLGSFYGYRITGIYQTQEEVDADNALTSDVAVREPGLFKFANLNGDNVINDDDREIIGNPFPDFIFGLTNDFSWKNFNLAVLIQGSIGQDLINASRYYLDALSVTTLNSNVSRRAYENRWTGPGSTNTYPKVTTSGRGFYNRFADFLVEDASYVRLKNITLSYSFPKRLIRFAESLKVFATATNVFTITNYSGYDPEVNSRAGRGMMPGIDSGAIPQYKTISGGVNINF
ncbi:MAG: SusC/RagA family TonB-linked outer membrane protein [Paludibacter sp.]|nr:SusC/RagA family TonB-linked outer membrane protein [Paludibacter sp.]